MKMLRRTGFLLVCVLALHAAAFAQEDTAETPETEQIFSSVPPPPPPGHTGEPVAVLLAPLNSASLWTMGLDPTAAGVDFDRLAIAHNPGDSDLGGLVRPQPGSVYFGVPPKSASSVISLGVTATDIDRFLSTTAYQDSVYQSAFGYFGFDNDSLSVGVSRKFKNGAVTSLYYNGNIIEDIFAYLSNNSLTNGRVGLGVQESTDTDYDFMGDLKDRNNINSRSNVNLLFGAGPFGINVGYSQKLFGLVKKSSADPYPDPTNPDDGIIDNAQQAILDNALVPNIELGFRLGSGQTSFRTTLGFQMDIHQHRELNKGEQITLDDYYATPIGTAYTTESVTRKLSADYMEPAVTLRLEADFPSDNRSQLGIGLEIGARMRMYSNLDDKGESQSGIFWSEASGILGANGYQASITERPLDLAILGRPSVRYVTVLGNSLKVGLSGGFGIGLNLGNSTTKTYKWADKDTYMGMDDPYIGAYLDSTATSTPSLDLGLYPNLGIGFSFAVVPDTFTLNGGVGATQTLYRIRTGEVEIEDSSGTAKMPILEQSWGKPLGQLALGASFSFKKNFTLDALFSTNGTSFDNANFVVQFSAAF